MTIFFCKARSTISNNSGSESSSSVLGLLPPGDPLPSPINELSEPLSTSPPASFVKSVSGVLSMSSSDLSTLSVSVKDVTSAILRYASGSLDMTKVH